jgi:hypothetical protein
MKAKDENDRLLESIARLRTYDVSQRHTVRLRSRCHALLQAQPRAHDVSFRRFIGPALGGVWCLAYLVEIIRSAVAMYGF